MSAQDDDQKLFHAFLEPIRAKHHDADPIFEIRHNPPGTEEESWQKCYELAEKYDKGLCDAYREEIDTLLVFAGLFSAVVTAFTIESYQWLHDDSGDVSVQLLAQIATRLNSTSPIQIPATSALSDATATRINVYWFISLVLSLSAALVGILAKQWIREYNRDAGRTHPESLGVRQMKLEGLEAWKVSEIVTSVPLLLQAALALFFLGIIELLWQLSTAVAVPVTIIIFLALCFYATTTALPAFHLYLDLFRGGIAQCPYKSPQAWLALRATMWFMKASLNRRISPPVGNLELDEYMVQFVPANESVQRAGSWIMLDLAWTAVRDTVGSVIPHPEYRFQALAWLDRVLNHTDMHNLIWHCLLPTATRRFTRHSSANILCCMPENTALEEIFPESPPICQSDQRRLCQIDLLRYALAASMPPETCADLLCHVFLRAEQMESLNAQDYDAFSVLFHMLLWSSQLPESVSDDLFLAMCRMTERRIDDAVAYTMLDQMNDLLSHNQPSQHNTQLSLAFCARARWWLDAAGALKRSGPRLHDAAWHAKICTNILRTSALNIRKTPYEVEDGPPYSLETVVFAYFARDIHSFTRSLRLDDPPPLRDIHDMFFKLVDVAASHLGGLVLYQPVGPLVYDSDNLFDLSLLDLDLDADQSPDVSVATSRMPRSEDTRAPHPSAGREHAGTSTEAAIAPLAVGDTETPRAAPRRGGSLRSASRGRTESTAGHGAPPHGEGDGTTTPAGEHTSPAGAVAGAAASDGTDAAGHIAQTAGLSLEHWDGTAAQDRDSGTALSAPGRRILEMLAAGEAARAASSPGHPALQALYLPTAAAATSGPPGRLDEEGDPAPTQAAGGARGPDRERTPIATAEPVGPPVIGWLRGTETREASRARTGEGTPPVPGGERTRRRSVDLELGMPRDSASRPGMPAPCPDECECSICVRQRL